MKGPDDRPLLLLDRKGEGRVGMLLSDQGWLWARGFEGGGPHVALYRRIAHWLMKEPELEEERLVAGGRGMTLDVVRQTMQDDPGPATVISPSGKTMTLAACLLAARRLHRQRPRSTRSASTRSATATSPRSPMSARSTRRNSPTPSRPRTFLRPPAEATGGSVRRIASLTGVSLPGIVPVRGSANAAGNDWIGLKTTDDSVLKSVSRVPLFGGFFGLGLLLLALGSMWYREGR